MKKPSMGLLVLGKEKEESDEGMSGGGSLSAAKAVRKALKAEDDAALDEALKLHYELCQSASYEDEE